MKFAAEDRSATGRRRVFHLLDALRGIAALAVMQRHLAWLMDQPAWASTYLAVDLFFVLSGFVIAYSHQDRLGRGMTWRRFMLLRVIRIYPLYAVGLALGILALLGNQLQRPSGPEWPVIGQAIVSAVLMLPNWHLPAIVGPRWSLTYELVANAAYAAVAPRLTMPFLAAVIAGAGAALVATVAITGTVDAGWDIDQAPIALTRVFFSFPMGVLLFRVHAGIAARRWLWRVFGLAALLIATGGMASLPLYLVVELATILLVFPAVTLLAAYPDVGGRGAVLCGFLGVTSYALYVVHQPASILYEAVLKRIFAGQSIVPVAGYVLAVLLLPACWLLDRYYDGPVRRRLTAWVSAPRRIDPASLENPLSYSGQGT